MESKVYCQNCGGLNTKDNKFCGFCGYSLEVESATISSTTITETPIASEAFGTSQTPATEDLGSARSSAFSGYQGDPSYGETQRYPRTPYQQPPPEMYVKRGKIGLGLGISSIVLGVVEFFIPINYMTALVTFLIFFALLGVPIVGIVFSVQANKFGAKGTAGLVTSILGLIGQSIATFILFLLILAILFL